jgi:hypothetical protein
MTFQPFEFLNADGSYNRAVIMRSAWAGFRRWKGEKPFGIFLRDQWERAKIERSLFETIEARNSMTPEEKRADDYRTARFEADIIPFRNHREFLAADARANALLKGVVA